MQEKKKSVLMLISGIIGALYSVYIVLYFSGAMTEDVGGAVATVLVMPHMICAVLGSIFAVVSYFTAKRGFAIASMVLFIVGAVLFPIYALFLIPSIILSIIGFIRMKNKKEDISNYGQN